MNLNPEDSTLNIRVTNWRFEIVFERLNWHNYSMTQTSKTLRVTIYVIKHSEVVFISSRLHSVSHQRTASLDVVYDVRPHTQHMVSRCTRPGRGDDRTARDADTPTSRRNPSCGFGRDLGANERSATPP